MDVFVGVSDIVDRKYMGVECSSDYTKERAALGGKSTACLLRNMQRYKKASSYIAQYPVLRTVQSALHFHDRPVHSDTI